MAGRRKAPLWRQAFLRALKRTGNVRASAFEAGVDPGTAYDHRAKDAGFRASWAGALKAFKAGEAKNPPSRKAMADNGEELVLRRSKDGDKLVRAAAGRWSRRVEESFLDGLEATGSVRAAAAAAGMSTAAVYVRRDNYPEFRARWDERVGRFREQLPGLINAAAVQSMEPDVPGAKRRGRARLPKLAAGEAIRVYAINETARAKGRGGARNLLRKPELSEEELVETVTRLLGMMKRRRAKKRRAAGWTEIDGIWLPPGWTASPPARPGPDAGPDPDDTE
jgi:hypothetical protein